MERELLNAIETEWNAGNACMLATVLSRRGSAPRGAGTGMVVSVAGEQVGTVGGGSMEFRVKQDALALLATGASAVKEYAIHADEKDVYSGGVTVLFRAFADTTAEALIGQMRTALEQQAEAYLVCEIANGNPSESRVCSAVELQDTCGISCAPEQPMLTETEPQWLIEPLREAPRVILFGGGHVAQCMARQLALLDYRIWVVEDREDFAHAALFPAAERVIHSGYDSAEALLRITKRDHGIVMSRGHETDYQILRWLLRSEADYIGCIGSRKKIALTKKRLFADGLSAEQIERLHAPIGLSIGAQTPAEIAVSVAAELIQYRSSHV